MAELSDRVAIVTGGASGIGLGAVRAMLDHGASVAIADNNLEHLTAVQDVLDAEHERVLVVHTDVTDESSVEAMVAATTERFGHLDVVVAAAGIQVYGDAVETTREQWNHVLDVNLTGAFSVISHALPALRASGHGSIVIVSSVQGIATQASVAAYTTTKGGLNAFARSLAVDEAQYGVRANAVCPGSVDTPLLRASARLFSDGTDAGAEALVRQWGLSHPLGRVGLPREIGEVIAFLASDRASFVTGASIPVDGGLLAGLAVRLPE